MLNQITLRGTMLLSCAVAGLAALPNVASASTTYITVTANWASGSGDWTSASGWSSAPYAPNNGTPVNTAYDATIGSGANVTVAQGENINVDSVTATGALTINGTLNLAQPDNGGSPGLVTGKIGIGNLGVLENAEINAPTASSGSYNIEFAGVGGTLRNVTLASNLTVTGNLNVDTLASGVEGLVANGYVVNLQSGSMTFNGLPAGTGAVYNYDGVINLYAPYTAVQGGSAAVNFTQSAVVNVLAPAVASPNAVGFEVNNGAINVGASAVSGAQARIGLSQNNGSITAYSGDTAALYFPVNNGILRAMVGGTIDMTGNSTPINAELASGSTLDIQLGSNGTSGLLTVDGSLQLDSGSALSLSQLAGSAFTTPYDIINYTGALTGTFTDVTPGYVLDYSHAGEILVTAVPEPTALALFAIGFAGLALKRRKRSESRPAA